MSRRLRCASGVIMSRSIFVRHCFRRGRGPDTATRVARRSRWLPRVLALCSCAANAAQVTVTTTTDDVQVDGAISLREALLSVAARQDLNADVAATRQFDYGDADSVRFAIAVDAQVIALGAPLPALANGAHLDGTSQPGYVGQNLITLDGTQAGATAEGLVLLEGSRITALDVVHFGSNGLRSDDDVLFAHGFDGSGVVEPVLRQDFVPASIEQCATLDNGGDGLRIDSGTAVTTTTLRTSRNHGVGLRVRGALAASLTVVSLNAGDGIVVDSADAVDLDQSNIQFNGQHPQLAPTVQSGIRVLRASRPDVYDEMSPGVLLSRGGLLVHGSGTLANHLGDGVVVGDANEQTGVIQAVIGDLQIHHNLTGIRVTQRDADTHRTAAAIVSNNIYQNAAAGIHLSTSYMYGVGFVDRRVISANDVHHNAVTPDDQCSVATATQTQSQVVFDGPVAATPAEIAACQPAQVDTLSECVGLNNPNGILSNGVNNHCAWTGTTCTVAWDMSGRSGVESCDSSRNRIFAYVNDQNASQSTQKGVAALNGAIVGARRNVWGSGGPGNATFSEFGSLIDSSDDCGSISTCP